MIAEALKIPQRARRGLPPACQTVRFWRIFYTARTTSMKRKAEGRPLHARTSHNVHSPTEGAGPANGARHARSDRTGSHFGCCRDGVICRMSAYRASRPTSRQSASGQFRKRHDGKSRWRARTSSSQPSREANEHPVHVCEKSTRAMLPSTAERIARASSRLTPTISNLPPANPNFTFA